MNNNDEYLYTDYTMQLFTAFAHKGIVDMQGLLSTYDDELDDESFIPGILFGFLVHFEMLLTCMATSLEKEVEEVFLAYAGYYNENRESLKEIPPLNPSFAKKAFEEFKKTLGQ
jgi:hypothetical protein